MTKEKNIEEALCVGYTISNEGAKICKLREQCKHYGFALMVHGRTWNPYDRKILDPQLDKPCKYYTK